MTRRHTQGANAGTQRVPPRHCKRITPCKGSTHPSGRRRGSGQHHSEDEGRQPRKHSRRATPCHPTTTARAADHRSNDRFHRQHLISCHEINQREPSEGRPDEREAFTCANVGRVARGAGREPRTDHAPDAPRTSIIGPHDGNAHAYHHQQKAQACGVREYP